MKYSLEVFLVFILISFPVYSFAFTQGYTGSGWGSGNANVDFCDSGNTSQGYEYFWNTGHDYFLAIQTSLGFDRYWTVTTDLNGSADYYHDYGGTGGANADTPDTVPSWTVNLGNSPSGTFVSIDCDGGGGGGGTEDSNTSTSTINQSQENIFHGIIIFMISFLGMFWMLKST